MKILTTALLSLTMISISALVAAQPLSNSDHITTVEHNQLVVRDNNQAALPPAQLGISPAAFNESVTAASARLDKSLTLYNYQNQPKTVKLTLIDLDVNMQPVSANSGTLKNWMLINPSEFTIAANGYQTIRLAFRPPQDFPKGVHRAVLLIEQQIINPISHNSDTEAVTMQIGSRYGLPITLAVN